MHKYIRFRYIILVLICLLAYAYNDIMTSNQSGFIDANRTSVHIILICLISVFVSYNIFHTIKTCNMLPLTKILLSIMCWVSIVNLLNNSDITFSLNHIIMCIWWITSYIFFYKYLRKNPQSYNIIILSFIIMFVFYIWANLFLRSNIATIYDQDNAVSGYIYWIVAMIPFIGLITRNWLRHLLWIIAIFMIITSFKRGAIITTPLMFIAYYFTKAKLRLQFTKFFVSVIMIAISSYLLFVFANTISNGYLNERFSREQIVDGSGRKDMWKLSYDEIANRSTSCYIIGSGSGSSVKLLGTGVHNEWLEFLFSFGLIGFIQYAIMCIIIFRRYQYFLYKRATIASLYGMMMMFIFSITLFSGMFFTHSSFYIFSFLGICEYRAYKDNQKQII